MRNDNDAKKKRKKKNIYINGRILLQLYDESPERGKCRDVLVTCFNILLIDLWLEQRQLGEKEALTNLNGGTNYKQNVSFFIVCGVEGARRSCFYLFVCFYI